MKKGFTLIELLIVIAIIGILTGISTFGLSQARQAARDGKRKNDLEYIRSGIETYRADCGTYPLNLPAANSPLTGTNPSGNCSTSNTYITSVPSDPLSPSHSYLYSSSNGGASYIICASLEGGTTTINCSGPCGGAGVSCNYKVTNP